MCSAVPDAEAASWGIAPVAKVAPTPIALASTRVLPRRVVQVRPRALMVSLAAERRSSFMVVSSFCFGVRSAQVTN